MVKKFTFPVNSITLNTASPWLHSAYIYIYIRSLRLEMKVRQPMGVYLDKVDQKFKGGVPKFVTDKYVAEHLRTCTSLILNIKKKTQNLTIG